MLNERTDVDSEAAAHAFLLLLHEDRERGAEKSLAEYQALFPGHEEEIARQHELLHGASPTEPPSRTRSIGRFELLSEIGRGGQGEVYLAEDKQLHRRVALKVLSLSPMLRLDALGRFKREAEAASRLSHPGICAIYEAGEADGVAYIAMQYIAGESLSKKLAAVRARAPDAGVVAVPRSMVKDSSASHESSTKNTELFAAVHLIERAARAMHVAHEAGIVHRDVKPGNIMVTPAGEPVILDFGLARDEESDAPSLTLSGALFGTPAYMSPEQVRSDRLRIDRRTDVYSLAATLFECLTLRAPFLAPTREGLFRAILSDDPPDLCKLNPKVPSDLRVVVETALEKDSDRRFQTALDLAEELRRVRERRPILTRPAGPLLKLGRWAQRNPRLATAITVAALALTGGLVASLVLKAQADRRADDVLRLSAMQDFEDLTAEAERLWPATPDKIDQYDQWLRRARELVLELEPDPEGGYEGHRARLAELEARALPYTNEERAADCRAHPRFAELERLQAKIRAFERAQAVRAGDAQIEEPALDASALPRDALALSEQARLLVDPNRVIFGREAEGLALARLALEYVEDPGSQARVSTTLAWAFFANGADEEAVAEIQLTLSTSPESVRPALEVSRANLSAAISEASRGAPLAAVRQQTVALEAEVSKRQWRFASYADRWWHAQLSALVAQLEALADPEIGLIEGFSPEHGWGIERRRNWADTIGDLTVTRADSADRWENAIASISDRVECPTYRGLMIEPQLGLVPIGRDPASGLWEFAHPMTGSMPVRGADGELVLSEETGLVLVLLSGGTFTMGAQASDPSSPNYNPQALSNEGPVHEEAVAPFFLSKYELTLGQWQRVTERDPSTGEPYRGFVPSLLHPVLQVSWNSCREVCDWSGLRLPTEAEWEYAARGGTTSVWWTGNDRDSLIGAVNLADQAAARAEAVFPAIEDWPELDDGYVVQAPVNRLLSNPFGLHNVHGNAWEWCLDEYTSFYNQDSTADSISTPGGVPDRVLRGGSYMWTANIASSSFRHHSSPEDGGGDIGLRPAKTITP